MFYYDEMTVERENMNPDGKGDCYMGWWTNNPKDHKKYT